MRFVSATGTVTVRERAERGKHRDQKGVDPPAEGWGGKLLIRLWWAQVYGDRIDIAGG